MCVYRKKARGEEGEPLKSRVDYNIHYNVYTEYGVSFSSI
jgi:hypothetical protein